MRTPKGKQRGGAKEVKKETNKLRKKAMKNKMMKKTMLTLAGDDTKEEFRDLINESTMSNISIIGRSPAPARNQNRKNSKKSPAEKRTPATRKSLRSLRSQVSLKSLSSKLSRNNSNNKEVNGMDMSMDTSEAGPGEKKAKLVKLEPGPTENGHEEATGSRLQGMKNMISSAVWGVPYAQVVEESEPLNSTQDNNSRCTIS